MTMTALATATNAPARSLWRFAEGETQLNHGSFGGVPVAILNAQQALKDEMEGDPVRWFCTLPDRVARARVEIASILGVPSDRLAMVPNASAGMSVVYSSMAGRERINVMTTNHGYGAVVMGAERLARRTGGHSAIVAIPLGASDEDIVGRVDDALSSNPTDLLVIDQITSGSARLLPTGKICDVAHDHGAVIAIDGAHAPGVLSEPVEEKADFWVGNLHKFWCAPRGAAVLVRNNPDLEVMPLIDSWGARDPFPARFDYQGTLDSTAWLVSPTAWNYLDETVAGPASTITPRNWPPMPSRSSPMPSPGTASAHRCLMWGIQSGLCGCSRSPAGQGAGPGITTVWMLCACRSSTPRGLHWPSPSSRARGICAFPRTPTPPPPTSSTWPITGSPSWPTSSESSE